ncbi:MAG: nodulation protein NfeD [Gammaproteobacteria bacterium]|nr:nodulation protein NfeD [Gammaproteobacteria bacterium]
MQGRFARLVTVLLLAATVGPVAGLLQAETEDAGTEENESTGNGRYVRLELKGAIGPATSDHITRGIEYAAETNAELIVIEMDTPGGLDSAMRDIIKSILASPVPVATWVAPSGSRAASAGTYILYASHIAAMAPATNLGAATPVAIGGGGGTPVPKPPDIGAPEPGAESDQDAAAGEENAADSADRQDADNAEPATTPDSSTATERKAVNDAVAYIRGLAELRGRNADWAEQAVREASSLSAEDALEQNVIDVVAATLNELLAAIDGRTVKIANGEEQLDTDNLIGEEYEADWRTKLLATITDPNIAYLLMLVGIYGLIFEGYNPGAIVPGVVGAICILLALYAFQVLSVNYAGLGLILLGIVLMIAEAFAPSFGALGIGGIAAFVFGSIILINSDVPGFGINRWLIGSIAALGGSLLLALMYFLMRNLRRPVVSGGEQMVGSTGEVLEDFDNVGQILVHGERWIAHSTQRLSKGQHVRVTAMEGLELRVQPID